MLDITKQSLSLLVENIKSKKLSSSEVTKAFVDRSEKSKKLNELETDKVETLSSIAETTLKLRPDEVKSKNISDQILKNSQNENKDFFVVPKVVE